MHHLFFQFNLKAVQRELENSVCKFAEYVTKAGVRQQGLGGGGVMGGGGAGSSFYRLPQMAQQLGMSLNGTFVLKSQVEMERFVIHFIHPEMLSNCFEVTWHHLAMIDSENIIETFI